jgi:hypothetical protein
MAEKRVIEIEVKTNAGAAATEISAVGVSATAASAGVTGLGNASAATGAKMGTFAGIKTAITGLVPALGAAEGGVMKLGAQFMKLLANPIILVIAGIVTALKFVYEAFQSNVQGGKEIAAVWEGLSAVGTQVKDATMGLVRAFGYAVQAAYKFLTLDFKGAAEAMKNANGEAADSFKQLGDAASGKTFKIVRALEKEQQANNKAKKEQSVAQSFVNKLLVQSREILTDETASMKDKKKALAEVTREETKAAAERVRIAAQDLKILQQKAKALGGQAEIKMKQEIREATIALNEAETEGAMTGIKLNRQKKMLARQEASEAKEAANEKKEQAKQAAAEKKEEAKQAASESKNRAKEAADKRKESAQAAKTEKETLIKEKEDTQKRLNEIEQNYADSLLSEEAKEIVGVQRKYKELYDQAAKHKLDITQLKKLEAAEKLKIEDKYDQQIFDKIAALTDTEQQKLYDAYQKEVKAAGDNKDYLLALENDYLKKKGVLDKADKDKKDAEDLKLKELTLSQEDFKLAKLISQYEADQLLYKDNKEMLKALDIKYSKDKEALENEELTKKRERTKKGIDMAMSALSILNDAFQMSAGKSEKDQRRAFKAQKAFNLASALTNTFLAVTGALTAGGNPVKLATGTQFVEAGLAAAAGAVQIAKIAKTQFDSGGSSAGGNDVATAPTMSAPQFNVVGQSGVNQLASLNQQPIQAYVVSGQVTSQQALDRNRLANATLGG